MTGAGGELVGLVSVMAILEHFWEHFLRESRLRSLPSCEHSFISLAGLLGPNPLLDARHIEAKELRSALGKLVVGRWRSHTQAEGDQRVIGCDGGPWVKWPSGFRLEPGRPGFKS